MPEQEPVNGLAPLHDKLRGALEVYETARDAILERIPAVQSECQHPQVLHADCRNLEYLRSLEPLRMCACCRIEEEGSMWSNHRNWNRADFGTPRLGNAPDRVVLHVEREQIYALRLPGPRYLAKKSVETA